MCAVKVKLCNTSVAKVTTCWHHVHRPQKHYFTKQLSRASVIRWLQYGGGGRSIVPVNRQWNWERSSELEQPTRGCMENAHNAHNLHFVCFGFMVPVHYQKNWFICAPVPRVPLNSKCLILSKKNGRIIICNYFEQQQFANQITGTGSKRCLIRKTYALFAFCTVTNAQKLVSSKLPFSFFWLEHDVASSQLAFVWTVQIGVGVTCHEQQLMMPQPVTTSVSK